MAWNRPLRCLIALCLLALIPGCGSSAPKLPALGADLSQTSVSGLSSGGYMAGQFQVAHSATVTGAAILAAGPYGCAQSAGAEAFPFFPAATASNLAQAQNGCTADRLSGLGVLDSGTLLRRASALADRGKIDPLSGLKRAKIYLYSGADDRTVVKPVVEAARNFYLAAGVPAGNIEFVVKNPGGHAFLSADKGAACDKSASPYVDNCGYDQAGAILRFIYGTLAPKGVARPENFLTFAQGDYAASAQRSPMRAPFTFPPPAARRRIAGCTLFSMAAGNRAPKWAMRQSGTPALLIGRKRTGSSSCFRRPPPPRSILRPAGTGGAIRGSIS